LTSLSATIQCAYVWVIGFLGVKFLILDMAESFCLATWSVVTVVCVLFNNMFTNFLGPRFAHLSLMDSFVWSWRSIRTMNHGRKIRCVWIGTTFDFLFSFIHIFSWFGEMYHGIYINSDLFNWYDDNGSMKICCHCSEQEQFIRVGSFVCK
jgi:hypothetical protein